LSQLNLQTQQTSENLPGMSFKIEFFSDGNVSNELYIEAKELMQALAIKYNCHFEVSREENAQVAKTMTESVLKSKLHGKVKPTNGIYLSFGGEIEL
jgi:hypothetical protein